MDALVEESPARLSTVFDFLKGAFEMQFSIPNFWRLLPAMSLLGLLLGWALSFALTPVYISSASLVLSRAEGSTGEPADLVIALLRYRDQLFSRTSLSSIMQDPRLALYEDELRKLPVEDVIEQMRGKLSFVLSTPTLAHNTGAPYVPFQIGFRFKDAAKAQLTVQQMVNRLQDAIQATPRPASPRDAEIARLEARIDELERRLGGKPQLKQAPAPIATSVMPAGGFPPAALFDEVSKNAPVTAEPRPALSLSILEAPTLPVRPAAPNRYLIALTGLICGACSAVLLAVLYRIRYPRAIAPRATV
jgi:hypothetical protein